MGQRSTVSYYDALTVNQFYQCGDGCTNDCRNEGYPRYKDRGIPAITKLLFPIYYNGMIC